MVSFKGAKSRFKYTSASSASRRLGVRFLPPVPHSAPLGCGQKEASLWPKSLHSVAKCRLPLYKGEFWRHFNFIMASIKCCFGVKYAKKRRQHRWVSRAGKKIGHRRNQIGHRRDFACPGRESRLGGRGFRFAPYQEAICPLRSFPAPYPAAVTLPLLVAEGPELKAQAVGEVAVLV